MDQGVVENGSENKELLLGVDDDHGGLIVELEEAMDTNRFRSCLRASLLHWKLQGIKGVWIKIPIELVNLVETAVKEGFRYHHAEPHYLMLVYWIPETDHTIPANATHRVRIGAIVLNDKRELLVVQEKNGRYKGQGIWKIPTGILDQGEDIAEGAVREVKEETQIDTEFVELLAFRQSHRSLFEKSELQFLCMMRPLSFNITKQDLEIDAAQWMPMEEYRAQSFVKENSVSKYIGDLCLAKVDGVYNGFDPVPTTTHFDDKISYMYLNMHSVKPKSVLPQERKADSTLAVR